jgi:hypothetical protein
VSGNDPNFEPVDGTIDNSLRRAETWFLLTGSSGRISEIFRTLVRKSENIGRPIGEDL